MHTELCVINDQWAGRGLPCARGVCVPQEQAVPCDDSSDCQIFPALAWAGCVVVDFLAG